MYPEGETSSSVAPSCEIDEVEAFLMHNASYSRTTLKIA